MCSPSFSSSPLLPPPHSSLLIPCKPGYTRWRCFIVDRQIFPSAKAKGREREGKRAISPDKIGHPHVSLSNRLIYAPVKLLSRIILPGLLMAEARFTLINREAPAIHTRVRPFRAGNCQTVWPTLRNRRYYRDFFLFFFPFLFYFCKLSWRVLFLYYFSCKSTLMCFIFVLTLG